MKTQTDIFEATRVIARDENENPIYGDPVQFRIAIEYRWHEVLGEPQNCGATQLLVKWNQDQYGHSRTFSNEVAIASFLDLNEDNLHRVALQVLRIDEVAPIANKYRAADLGQKNLATKWTWVNARGMSEAEMKSIFAANRDLLV